MNVTGFPTFLSTALRAWPFRAAGTGLTRFGLALAALAALLAAPVSAEAAIDHREIDEPKLVDLELGTDLPAYDLCWADHADQARATLADLAAEVMDDPERLYALRIANLPAQWEALNIKLPHVTPGGAANTSRSRSPRRRGSRALAAAAASAGLRDMHGEPVSLRDVRQGKRAYTEHIEEALLDVLDRVRQRRPGARLTITGFQPGEVQGEQRYQRLREQLDFVYVQEGRSSASQTTRSRRRRVRTSPLQGQAQWLQSRGLSEERWVAFRLDGEWVLASQSPLPEQMTPDLSADQADQWEGRGEDDADLPEGEIPDDAAPQPDSLPHTPPDDDNNVDGFENDQPSFPDVPGSPDDEPGDGGDDSGDPGEPDGGSDDDGSGGDDSGGDGSGNNDDDSGDSGGGDDDAGGDDDDGSPGGGGGGGSGDDSAYGPYVTPGGGFSGPTPQPNPTGDGPEPTAQWSTAPYQVFQTQFNVFVSASHPSGVDRVEFSADGGQWAVDQAPSENPATGGMDYRATLEPDEFDPGELVEIRAVVYPDSGKPKVLQGALAPGAADAGDKSLFLYAHQQGDPPDMDAAPDARIALLPSQSARMAPHTVHVHATDSDLGDPSFRWSRTKIEWDFGDDTGSPQTVTDPRTGETVDISSEQQGFNAAYIYDEPGEYTITVTLTNEAGVSDSDAIDIEIEPDARAVRYVDAQSGSDANSGASPSSAWRTYNHAIDNLTSDMKVLFKRGQTFDVASAESTSAVSNAIIGAYGSGDKPVINWTGDNLNVDILDVDRDAENTLIENLTFFSPFDPGQSNVSYIANTYGPSGPATNMTVRDCETVNGKHGIDLRGTVGVLTLRNKIAQTENRAWLHINTDQFVSLGDYAEGPVNGHILRYQSSSDGVNRRNSISFSELDRLGTPLTTIRLDSVMWSMVFRSRIAGGPVEFSHNNGPAKHMIADANVMESPGNFGVTMNFKNNAVDVSVRNNVVIQDNNSRAIGLSLEDSDPDNPDDEQAPVKDVDIVNNTFLYPVQNEGFQTLAFSTNTQVAYSGVRFANNLIVSAPSNRDYIRVSHPDGIAQFANNVFPEVPNGYDFAEIGGSGKTWAEYDALPFTSNETREDVDPADLGPPAYQFDPDLYPTAASHAQPFPGVFEDYQGQPRTGSAWSAGAASSEQ